MERKRGGERERERERKRKSGEEAHGNGISLSDRVSREKSREADYISMSESN